MESNVKHELDDSAVRTWLAGVVLATVLVLVSVVSSAGPASAYTVSSSGSPGTAAVPITYADWSWSEGNSITVPWRRVWESTRYARYNQKVCVRPRLWGIDNWTGPRWVLLQTRQSCAWIPGVSRSVDVNGAVFGDLYGTQGYGVDVVVTWTLANGQRIGSRTYDYSARSDYRCLDTAPRCRIRVTNWGGGANIRFGTFL